MAADGMIRLVNEGYESLLSNKHAYNWIHLCVNESERLLC